MDDGYRDYLMRDREYWKQDGEIRLDFQIQFAMGALKNLLLVNGGAIVALMTFAGNAKHAIAIDSLRLSFGGFVVGLMLALLAHMCGYFSQAQFMHVAILKANAIDHKLLNYAPPKSPELYHAKSANIFLWIGIACSILSWAAFTHGAFQSINGLR